MDNPVHSLMFNRYKQVPLILQTEVAECGLACIAMIANYYGYQTNLNELRQRYSISLKGANIKNLSTLAENLNFSTRAVKLDLDAVDNLQLPCVLHWNMNHFVVLTKVSRNHFTVNDPATGIKKLSREAFSKHFTGVALEFRPAQSFEKKEEEITMKLSDLWGQISGLKRAFFQVFKLSVMLQVFALITPFYMQIVVDDVIVGNNTELLTLLGLGFGLLVLIGASTELLRSYIVMYLSNQLNVQIATNLFRHLLRLPAQFFEKRHIGDVLSRFRSLDHIRDLLTTGLIESIVDGMLVIVTLVMMYIYNGLLASIVISFVLLYGAIRILFFPKLRQYSEEAIYAEAHERTNFLETIRASESIKLFGKENQRQSVWSNRFAKAINADIQVNKFTFSFKAAENLLFGIEGVVVIYLGATFVLSGELSVGMLFAFIAYKLHFSTKAAAVIGKYIDYKMLGLHLNRIADIALTPVEEIGERVDSQKNIKGQITVSDIYYQYSKEEPLVLNGASFAFEAGKSTAIIGPSGCGKTTLVKIMLGLLQPDKGKVLLDGVDVSHLGLANYRPVVAAVMQNDHLLSGSLMENITFFSNEVDKDFAIECSKMAQIHDDICNMPMGYESFIGDMGSSLSGGQQQRLLLARALYKKPLVLFLDEATSHLDRSLEFKVSDAIKKLNITRIIIAHRKETIKTADNIIILKEGRVKKLVVKAQPDVTPDKK